MLVGLTCFPKIKGSLLLVATSRRIDAAGTIRRRATPDALVPAGAMPMYLVGGVYATVPVACAAAPLAVLFVVAMLVDLVRAVNAAMTIARTAAMPTFTCHVRTPFVGSKAYLGLRRGSDTASCFRTAMRHSIETRHLGRPDPAGLDPDVTIEPHAAKHNQRQPNNGRQNAF